MKKSSLLFLMVLIPFMMPNAQAGTLGNVLHACNNPGNTFAYSTSWSNDTHYMDTTDCKMILINTGQQNFSDDIPVPTIFDVSDLQFAIIIIAIMIGIMLFFILTIVLKKKVP